MPVDIDRLINLNGWIVVKYADLLKNPTYEFLLDFMKDNLGFSLKVKKNYIIFIDELSIFDERFTLAHEIGHIELGHFFTIKNDLLEKEANMFATRLLMPMCVLHECNVESAEDISNLCQVSLKCARYRFARLQLVRQRNKFYTDKLESKVRNLFSQFIDKNKH